MMSAEKRCQSNFDDCSGLYHMTDENQECEFSQFYMMIFHYKMISFFKNNVYCGKHYIL